MSSKDWHPLHHQALANPGETAPADLVRPQAPHNYAKLAAPPILYTYFDADHEPAPDQPPEAEPVPGQRHPPPARDAGGSGQSRRHGQMHFCGGENGNLRAWSINADKSSAYLGMCGLRVASARITPPAQGRHAGLELWRFPPTATRTASCGR